MLESLGLDSSDPNIIVFLVDLQLAPLQLPHRHDFFSCPITSSGQNLVRTDAHQAQDGPTQNVGGLCLVKINRLTGQNGPAQCRGWFGGAKSLEF